MKKSIKILWGAVIGLLLILLMILAFIVVKNRDNKNDYDEKISMGDKYLTEMDYENAEICFKEAITINPKQAKPYIQLSEVYIQTERYQDALIVLNDALEAIPASETTKVDAVTRKKAQVEALIQEPEPEVEIQEEVIDQLEIAKSVLNLPYLPDNATELQFVRQGQYGVRKEPLYQTGIVSADLYDYDSDGQDEILVMVLIGGTEASMENTLHLYMLENGENDDWSVAAQHVVQNEYGLEVYSILTPSRVEVFASERNGQRVIFIESTGVSSFFVDGISWLLLSYQYRDQGFVEYSAPIHTAGSDGIADHCMAMDSGQVTYAPDLEYVNEFITAMNNLGFSNQQLGLDNPMPENSVNGDCRKIVRLQEQTSLSSDMTNQWQQSGTTEPLLGVSLFITDFQKPAETTASQTSSYQVEILNYEGHEDIQYPHISPSTPEVDAWNQHFLEMAAEMQKKEDDEIAAGTQIADTTQEAEVTYLSGAMLSVAFYTTEYYGGAHGVYDSYGETIDLESDHMYMLDELLNTDNGTARRMVNSALNQATADDPDRSLADVSTDFSEVGYWKTDTGIEVVSKLYWLQSYAAGTRQVTLQPVS